MNEFINDNEEFIFKIPDYYMWVPERILASSLINFEFDKSYIEPSILEEVKNNEFEKICLECENNKHKKNSVPNSEQLSKQARTAISPQI